MRETRNLSIGVDCRLNPRPSRIFADSGRFSIFLLIFIELLFLVFSLVFAKRRFTSALNSLTLSSFFLFSTILFSTYGT